MYIHTYYKRQVDNWASAGTLSYRYLGWDDFYLILMDVVCGLIQIQWIVYFLGVFKSCSDDCLLLNQIMMKCSVLNQCKI